MDRSPAHRGSLWLVALLGVLPIGCGGPTNNFLSEGHRLTDTTKSLRQSSVPPTGLPRELDKRVSLPYVVEPGDGLLVQPVNLDSPVRLPGDQPVLPDGTIQLGVYGHVLAAGKTVAQIEAEVNALIRAKTADAGPITVRLISRDSKVYYVIGEVNAPNAYPLRGRETVLDAIMAAGNLTNNASRRNIILSRPTPPDSCRVVLPVCWNEIVQNGDTTTNYQIQAGDRIYVPSRTLWEQICHNKPECAPCGGLQVPCPGGDCAEVQAAPVHYNKAAPVTILPPAITLAPQKIAAPRPEGDAAKDQFVPRREVEPRKEAESDPLRAPIR